MSDGLKLISAVLSAGSVGTLTSMDREVFLEAEQEAYDFVRAHIRSYRELPTPQTVQENTGKRLPPATESLQYYVDRVYERHDYNQIRDRFAGLRDGLSARDMAAVSETVSDMSRVLRRRRPGAARAGETVNIRQGLSQVVDRLAAIKGTGGVSGITTGWNYFDSITGGYQKGDIISWVGRMGLGKCMDPTTPVILFGGAVRSIGDLKPGDKLLGPDSKPRTVLSTIRGRDPMFRITPTRGDSFVCNGAHILVLACDFDVDRKHTKGSNHLYSVDQFNELPQRVRANLRLVRVAIDFKHEDVEVSPYYVGLWLGDGCVQNGRISTIDKEIEHAVYEEAARFGMEVKQHETRFGFCPQYALVNGRNKEHVVMDFFRIYCISNGEKRIPGSYLRNSRAVRLELLAGLIDTDGSLHADGTGYEFTTKYPGLRDDMLYLCRSLGLCATSTEKWVDGRPYQRLYITGQIDMVPVRLPGKRAQWVTRRSNVLHQAFTVESLGEGEYAGITLDGDHLYLLGDFTVTHNTYIALRQAIKAHEAGENVLFVTTEMAIEHIARRVAAITLGVNPMHLKSGMISTYIERRIREMVRSYVGADRFKLFSVGMNSKVSAIEALCQEFGPTVTFIDGVYLLRPTEIGKNATQRDRVTGVYDELKGLALEADHPFVVTTQFNRQAGKGGREGTLETIGYTDAVGTHSSIVVAIKDGPTEDPKDSREFDFLKGREGESGKVAIKFKFAPLDMEEMSRGEREAEGEVTQETIAWMGPQ